MDRHELKYWQNTDTEMEASDMVFIAHISKSCGYLVARKVGKWSKRVDMG